jgi:nitroimidazol reductase NimA-like FMN-containing flavoprotein (pyridoxamine 5'-phosphate oxidase superfamily)
MVPPGICGFIAGHDRPELKKPAALLTSAPELIYNTHSASGSPRLAAGEIAMTEFHALRRKEKEIKDPAELKAVLAAAKYVTVAMCRGDEPYLVTLSHGYDEKRNALYFHCAREGKKIEILAANDRVWGQALLDRGYVDGRCDHLFTSVQFHGRVSFVEEEAEKRHALAVMIRQLESDPGKVEGHQVNDASVAKVHIGRIDLDYLSGKKSAKVIESL